jgi:glycosyltransferase involved in cell wall biosynthesis
MEAMAYGLPVVGVDFGGISEIIEPGEVGFLAAKQDPIMIANELCKLSQSTKRFQMGYNAKRRVLNLCSTERVGKSIIKLLNELQFK